MKKKKLLFSILIGVTLAVGLLAHYILRITAESAEQPKEVMIVKVIGTALYSVIWGAVLIEVKKINFGFSLFQLFRFSVLTS